MPKKKAASTPENGAKPTGLPDLSDPKVRAAKMQRIGELLMMRHYEDYKLAKERVRREKHQQRYHARMALTYMFRLDEDALQRKSYKQLVGWMDQVIAYIHEQMKKEPQTEGEAVEE